MKKAGAVFPRRPLVKSTDYRLGQRVDSERATEVGVGLQTGVVADCAQTVRRLVEASCQTMPAQPPTPE